MSDSKFNFKKVFKGYNRVPEDTAVNRFIARLVGFFIRLDRNCREFFIRHPHLLFITSIIFIIWFAFVGYRLFLE